MGSLSLCVLGVAHASLDVSFHLRAQAGVVKDDVLASINGQTIARGATISQAIDLLAKASHPKRVELRMGATHQKEIEAKVCARCMHGSVSWYLLMVCPPFPGARCAGGGSARSRCQGGCGSCCVGSCACCSCKGGARGVSGEAWFATPRAHRQAGNTAPTGMNHYAGRRLSVGGGLIRSLTRPVRVCVCVLVCLWVGVFVCLYGWCVPARCRRERSAWQQ